MPTQHFHLVYDTEFFGQILAIEKKYHSLIRAAIKQQLEIEPDVETRNRKPLTRVTIFGARWELRFGDDNEFRVFYSVYPDKLEVHILSVGIKIRERLFIGGKEIKL